ncbi:hypothetical protein RHIZ404_200988 [Rhizobium sp. EC-SD404]|nr:hypothetical protein RHIZ404_200988 [Rhizobium sp. EC-SD404]
MVLSEILMGLKSLDFRLSRRLARWLLCFVQGPEGTSKTASNDAKMTGRWIRHSTSDGQARTGLQRPFILLKNRNPMCSIVWNNSKLLIS